MSTPGFPLLLIALACVVPSVLSAAARKNTAAPASPAPAQLVPDETYAPLLEEPGGGRVLAGVLFDDGRAVIGGTFEFVHDTAHRYFAGLRADGSLDPEFAPDGGPDGPVHAILALPDGGLLLGGAFRAFGRTPARGFVQLSPDGRVDPDFATPTQLNGEVTALARQPDGQLLIGGTFDQFAGRSVPGLVRVATDGNYDESFAAALRIDNLHTTVRSLALLPDGALAVVARHEPAALAVVDSVARPQQGLPAAVARLHRLRADGSVDEDFARQRTTDLVPERVFALPDGRLLLAGSGELQRLEASGAVDGRFQFDQQGAMQVNAAHVLEDGRVLVGGSELPGSTLPARLMLLQPDGRAQARFVMPRDQHHAFFVLSRNQRGRVLAAGRIAPAAERLSFSKTENRVLLLDERLAVDRRFQAAVGAAGRFTAVAPDRRGGLTLAGNFKAGEGLTGLGLVRLAPDGAVDRSFRPTGNLLGQAHLLVPLPDGGALAGGILHSEIAARPPRPLVRLRPDGTPDVRFVPELPLDGLFTDGAVLPDGTVALVGAIHGRTYDLGFSDFVRLDLGGFIDRDLAGMVPTWLAGRGGRLLCVASTSDGHVLVGGEFTRLQNQPRAALARIAAGGVVDPRFVPDTAEFAVIAHLQLLPDQRIFVDGWAIPTKEQPLARRFARLLPNGSHDPAYSPRGLDAGLEPVLARMLDDGSTVVVLHDRRPDAASLLRAIQLAPDGSRLSQADWSLGNQLGELCLLPGAPGTVYLAGAVSMLDEQPRHGLARLVPAKN